MPTAPAPSPATSAPVRVHRVDVRPRPEAGDPKAASVQHDAASLGLAPVSVQTARIYLIEGPLAPTDIRRIADRLLADPVLEVATTAPTATGSPGIHTLEVHPLPGVMDPAAQSVREAIRDLTGHDVQVSTGWRYDLAGLTQAQADTLARRLLANPVVHAIHHAPHHPDALPRGHSYTLEVRHVVLRSLDDTALERLSRDAHLFLDLAEMRAIQGHYQSLGRDPTEIELETLAQTWSEHCVHKTLKSTIRYRGAPSASSGSDAEAASGKVAERQSGKVTDRGLRGRSDDTHTPRPLPRSHSATLPFLSPSDPIDWSSRPNHTVNPDGSITIKNLLKSTVAAATHELIQDGVDWCLSVFVDNAGIIAFDEHHAVCVKVETHNHPSAIEPYGGAATGIGGCIRDILGTGLGARPIASTDVFCVAHPDQWTERQNAESAEGNKRNAEESQGGGAPAPPSSSAPSAFSARAAFDPISLPPGCLHPRRVLTDVVAGVRDYGNRMGIPTVSGAVWFDNRHIGNPLVFCGCIGLMPRWAIGGKARAGDRIIALGGRTGRDGIHGATFSSAELTDTHADEFAHAVQIGNAITEKRVLDVVMRARGEQRSGRVAEWQTGEVTERGDGDRSDDAAPPRTLPLDHSATSPLPCLFSAITDCGAGGFSSAVGEMGGDLGATVHLDRAPLKYDGLSPTEIWISEAQERMVLAVPPSNVAALQQICDEEGVEMADLGEFGTEGRDLILLYHDTEVGRLSMEFLHDGIPTPTREAEWGAPSASSGSGAEPGSGKVAKRPSGNVAEPGDSAAATQGSPPRTLPLRHSATLPLLALLQHPNIASKHWIIRQYDHEVQGRTVVKPLTGPGHGPSDAAVIEPVPGTGRGLAISQGLATGYMVAQDSVLSSGSKSPSEAPHASAAPKPSSESWSTAGDPYLMTLAAIDECVRNLVCAGADPSRIAILDNFCWPSCKKPRNLGSLVRAAEACYDGAKAYRTPFVSGKDSLNNQFTIPGENGAPPITIEIPPTLLITGIGIVPTLDRVVTIDAKRAGNLLVMVGQTQPALAGSHLALAAADTVVSTAVGGVPPPPHPAFRTFPRTDLTLGPRLARAVHNLIVAGHIASAHDVSDGGLLCAVAEMLIAAGPAGLGAELLGPEPGPDAGPNAALDPTCWAFSESPSRYVLEIAPDQIDAVRTLLAGLPCEVIGQVTPDARLRWAGGELDLSVADLTATWTRTLDW